MTLLALVLLSAIIVSGGAVRVTGSGLGCPDWPTCEDGRLVAQLFEESSSHRTIENVNRLVTGLVSAAVILAVLGSFVRVPRRRDLTWLSLGLVGGVLGQIVLGGITVLTDLHPVAVQSHFLLSLVIVACAVVLHWRAGVPEASSTFGGPTRELPHRPLPRLVSRLSGLTLVLLVPAIVAGTVLTGTGPHGGDPEAQRFALDPRRVAQVHGVLVEVFTAALLVTLVVAWRRGASRRVLRHGSVAVAVVAAQSVLGYTQYLTGVPALLVGLHILGATGVWIAVLRWHLGLVEVVPAGSLDRGQLAGAASRTTVRMSSP
ncbi:MAG: COX15/CtaA family protein [Acidimicrobiales bacterium]